MLCCIDFLLFFYLLLSYKLLIYFLLFFPTGFYYFVFFKLFYTLLSIKSSSLVLWNNCYFSFSLINSSFLLLANYCSIWTFKSVYKLYGDNSDLSLRFFLDWISSNTVSINSYDIFVFLWQHLTVKFCKLAIKRQQLKHIKCLHSRNT